MTCVFIAVPDGTGYFNPHPHTEDDYRLYIGIARDEPLQSTSSHGG